MLAAIGHDVTSDPVRQVEGRRCARPTMTRVTRRWPGVVEDLRHTVPYLDGGRRS